MNQPKINVTPLIDVLLVLLIIFMVVAPIKPHDFSAKVPGEPSKDLRLTPNSNTLVVTIAADSTLRLDREASVGTVNDTRALVEQLKNVFAERDANGDISETAASDKARPMRDLVERTVFVKAPRKLDYGSVIRVVDAVKLAGAYPISLQIDDLE